MVGKPKALAACAALRVHRALPHIDGAAVVDWWRSMLLGVLAMSRRGFKGGGGAERAAATWPELGRGKGELSSLFRAGETGARLGPKIFSEKITVVIFNRRLEGLHII